MDKPPPPPSPMPSLHAARMMQMEADARAGLRANPDNPRTAWWNVLRDAWKALRKD